MQASGPCSGFAVYFCPLSGTGHGCLIGNAILYPGWEEFPSVEQREGELVYLKLDMDGADGKALSSQGILAGTEYEYYKPFDDAPEYEEYKEVPKWLKVVAGVAVAAVVGLAVAATAASDQKNGTESSLGDYISNAFSASARVGASCIAITLGMYGAEVMTMTVSGGLGLIPVGGTVVTLPQLAGAFLLVAGTVTSQNLLLQMREVLMFCISGKEMGAPTGNWLYDSAREITEMASMQFAVYGLVNPYTYQRPKITPLPNETGLTVPGGTGVAVVPNGTAPALKQPYLPGQYSEYPAAVQGWAQQALPGGGSGIEGSTDTLSTPSSKVLRQNLIESGVEVPDYLNAAYHIVAGSSPKAAEARAILQKYGIDINDSANGVFLPTVRGVAEGAYHPSLHTNAYYDKINKLLGEATCKEDVLDILEFISDELSSGSFME